MCTYWWLTCQSLFEGQPKAIPLNSFSVIGSPVAITSMGSRKSNPHNLHMHIGGLPTSATQTPHTAGYAMGPSHSNGHKANPHTVMHHTGGLVAGPFTPTLIDNLATDLPHKATPHIRPGC
ncbi:hypothetical protein AMTR_s00081p00100790 [Amborella trichopoda]|uniref:Uncharacterized protein n=1 Tax=Amborella trichopoda TaxID=13333 RepID=W1PBT9_AMBTC|nr:hypothetical protein AMTR_s00081p00100790 [Amborella trichopoda]